MTTAKSFLVLLFTAFSAFAADTPISSLEQSLTPIIRKYFPAAEIQATATSYGAKHGTMQFTVHGRLMTGEILSKTGVEEGPNHTGFLLRIDLADGPYLGQAVTPQDYREVYWTTFLDASKVPGSDQHLGIRFSYGARLNQEFKKAVIDALAKLRPSA